MSIIDDSLIAIIITIIFGGNPFGGGSHDPRGENGQHENYFNNQSSIQGKDSVTSAQLQESRSNLVKS